VTVHRRQDLPEAVRQLSAETGADRLGLAVVALGWATVDTERGVAELAAYGPFEPVADETILGARCVVGPPATGDIRVAVVEPNTEGRLAATLARHDEGPAVLWVAGTPPADIPVSTQAHGPFGNERLVLGGRLGGRHLIVVTGPAGTIER
jgi:hypothetical protein